MIWNIILNLIARFAFLWATKEQQVAVVVSDEKAKRAESDLADIKHRVEQKQKVDDEINRLSPDDRRERLRQWAKGKPKPPDGRSGG